MKGKRSTIYLFLFIAAIILGDFIAAAAVNFPFLQWLAFGKTIGISADAPMVINLSILKLAFGLEIGINLSQIICIVAAGLIGRRITKNV